MAGHYCLDPAETVHYRDPAVAVHYLDPAVAFCSPGRSEERDGDVAVVCGQVEIRHGRLRAAHDSPRVELRGAVAVGHLVVRVHAFGVRRCHHAVLIRGLAEHGVEVAVRDVVYLDELVAVGEVGDVHVEGVREDDGGRGRSARRTAAASRHEHEGDFGDIRGQVGDEIGRNARTTRRDNAREREPVTDDVVNHGQLLVVDREVDI